MTYRPRSSVTTIFCKLRRKVRGFRDNPDPGFRALGPVNDTTRSFAVMRRTGRLSALRLPLSAIETTRAAAAVSHDDASRLITHMARIMRDQARRIQHSVAVLYEAPVFYRAAAEKWRRPIFLAQM